WAQQQHQRAEAQLVDLEAHPRRRDRALLEQARQAVAQTGADLEQAVALENRAATALRRYTEQHQAREQSLAESAARRQDLADAARQLTDALNQARSERVIAAARGESGHQHLY